MKVKLFINLILVLLIFDAHAQIPQRAQKYFDQAMQDEAKKEYKAAREKMGKAIDEYPAFTDASSILGTWYFNDHQFKKSAAVFQKAYNLNKWFAFPLAKSLVYAGDETSALQIIPSFSSNEWNKLRQQALFVQQAMARAWRDTAFNIGRPNTSDAEMFPSFINDHKISFTRRVNNIDEDFFTAEVDSCGGWFAGINMGSPPNTLNQEAAQSISADGHYLFYMQCENRSENGWGQGGCDLYMRYRSDSMWSDPQSFGATINTPGYEGMPCLSPDNRELYFVSDRPGGYGGLDIWVARFENGLWQKPKNLGPNINTSGDETAPFIHADNSTFYFSSNGHQGMGGADLFMSKKINDTTWTKAINMGYPINSTADETGISINTDGTRLLFSSDRDSISGNFDIYEMKLPKTLQPSPVSTISGYVYDSLTKARLNFASIFIKSSSSFENLYHYTTNRGDGSFTITLPNNETYFLETIRIAYKERLDTINLLKINPFKDSILNIALLPADYVPPVNDSNILTVHFPINGTKLSDSDKIAIKNAMTPWVLDKQAFVMYVNGYTDNSGTPMINEQLSFLRAQLVANEVMTMGVDEMNIHIKGWGEENPVSTNDTPENMDKNRRVEIIIRR